MGRATPCSERVFAIILIASTRSAKQSCAPFFGDPKTTPRRAQDAPKTPQHAPKTPLGRPKTPPRRPQKAPRCSQDAPRRPQDHLKMPPRRPKTPRGPNMLPRRSQNAPKMPPRRPRSRKMKPTWSQVGMKIHPKSILMLKTSQTNKKHEKPMKNP